MSLDDRAIAVSILGLLFWIGRVLTNIERRLDHLNSQLVRQAEKREIESAANYARERH